MRNVFPPCSPVPTAPAAAAPARPTHAIRRLSVMVAAASIVAAASGCASTGVVRVGSSQSSKPSNCSLDVYSSREDVKRPFAPVCLVASESGSTLFNDRSDEGRLEAVKEKACECGADAIVVRDMSRTATRFGHGYSQARISIEAIIYKR